MKKFTKKVEDFSCENCGRDVKGDGYTNHCSHCLWSKHVDINPGDRASDCCGMMEPKSYEKSGEVIIHQCQKCGLKKKNKMSGKDNFDKMLKVQ